MLTAREKKGFSQSRLAEAADVGLIYVIDFEKLKFDRYGVEAMRLAAMKVAIALELPVDLVFPPELEDKAVESERTAVTDVEPSALFLATESFKTRMIAMAPDDELILRQDPERSSLETLIERWKKEIQPGLLASQTRRATRAFKILSLRAAGLTLNEVGEKVGLSGTRVAQLELSAIALLRDAVKRKGRKV